MSFWMILFAIVGLVGWRIHWVATEDLFENRYGQELVGAIMAFVGFFGCTVTLLVFAWRYLP